MKNEIDTTQEQQVMTHGSRAVVINRQGSFVYANLYVGARSGLQDAAITSTRWTGKTMSGARRWATKQLEKA